MTDNIATQLAVEWAIAQRSERESKIKQLKDELEKAQKEYDDFTAFINQLKNEDCADGTDNEADFFNQSHPHEPQTTTTVDIEGENENEDNTSSEDTETTAHTDEEVNSYDDKDEAEDYQEEEDNSSPKDWLRPEYQNRPMEDVVYEILRQCQPARPADVAIRMYQIGEDDPNFDRARNSANATLTNGRKTGRWKTLKRGVYVLNSYPDSFEAIVIQNGHHQTYQAV